MGAILDLWKSERGLVAVALIAAATVITGLGFITPEQWVDYTKWIFVTYAASKTITGSIAIATQPSAGATTSAVTTPTIPNLLRNSDIAPKP